jgi:peptidyl-prolyl cis-trans isomerase B (cyclophilin B)
MARSQHPDSAGSQFYFCLGPQTFLDGNYTVFGDPVDEESIAVIHSLEKGDEIVSVEIENGD